MVYFLFCAYIHTSCRLIQDQYIAIICQPFCQYHLLLIAAGEISHQLLSRGCFDTQRFDLLPCDLLLLFPLHKARLIGNLFQNRQHRVFPDTLAQQCAVDFSVLRHHTNPQLYRILRRPDIDLLPVQENFAACLWHGSKNQLGVFRPPGPYQATQAQDFTPVEL